MRSGRLRAALLLIAILAGAATAGCFGPAAESGGRGDDGGSYDQSSVVNDMNRFTYGGQVGRKTGNESYPWVHTYPQAEVTWGGQVVEGSATLTILDAAGREVFRNRLEGLAQTGQHVRTGAGVPGEWTVALRFDDATAQMGLYLRPG